MNHSDSVPAEQEPLARIATIFSEQRAVTTEELLLMREAGVSARLLRGIAGTADFERLTEQAYWDRRPFVMMLDANGIAELLRTAMNSGPFEQRPGAFGLELARAAGWPDDFTRELKETPGMCFKIALVLGGEQLAPATWRTVLAAMQRHLAGHERAVSAIDEALPELQAAASRGDTLGDLLDSNAHNFAQCAKSRARRVRKDKIDQAAFDSSEMTKTDVLRYTMECIGANELFTGDGFTRTVDGHRGPRELLAPNQPLKAFAEHLLVDLPIARP